MTASNGPLTYRGIVGGNIWLTGLFGAVLLLAPGAFAGVLGIAAESATLLFIRAFATALVFVAVLSAGLRDSTDRVVQRTLLAGNVVQDALLGGLVLHAVASDVVNGRGLVLAAIFAYEVFANGWAWWKLRS